MKKIVKRLDEALMAKKFTSKHRRGNSDYTYNI